MRRELSVVAREPYDKCFSQVAARRTVDSGIDQEIDPGSDLSRCRAAQNNRQVQVIGDSRCYAESWQIARKASLPSKIMGSASLRRSAYLGIQFQKEDG